MSREEEIEEIRKILSEQGIKVKIIPTILGIWITLQYKDKLIDTYIDDYFDMINE